MTTEIPPVDNPINQNYLSPNKYRIAIVRFPNLNFFAKAAPLPGYTTGSTWVPTGAATDYYQIGDKIRFNDFRVVFNIDEDMQTIKELLNWSLEAMKQSEKNFNPFSDMSIISLTNNNNTNVLFKIHTAFPYLVEDIDFSSKSTEDQTPTMTVSFKFSHYSLGGTTDIL